MKKGLLLLFVVPLIVMACGGGSQEAEVKAFLDEMATLSENYAADLEKADSGKALASAINTYMDGLIEISKKGKELEKKYPDVDKDAPYMKEYDARMQKASDKIQKFTSQKMMKFLMDPEVAKAMQDMQKKMSKVEVPYQDKK